jgi:hypothetical protein
MNQLQNKAKLIDHQIVSFGLRSEYGNSSYIKFGGYDVAAMENNNTDSLNFFPCKDNKKWIISMSGMRVNSDNVKLSLDGVQNMELDPAVPYVYIPAA